MMRKVAHEEKTQTPVSITIPYVEGDGIGKEITEVCHAIINTAVQTAYQGERSIRWLEVLAGQKSYNLTKEWLPEQTLEIIRNHRICMAGPVYIPPEYSISSFNQILCRKLKLDTALQPLYWYNNRITHQTFRLYVFHKNKEALPYESNNESHTKQFFYLDSMSQVKCKSFDENVPLGIEMSSMKCSENLAKTAIRYAIRTRLQNVTLLHKDSQTQYTEKAFKQWVYQIADTEFPENSFCMYIYHELQKLWGKESAKEELEKALANNKVIIRDADADDLISEILEHPERHSVLVALNFDGNLAVQSLLENIGRHGITSTVHFNGNNKHILFSTNQEPMFDIAGKNQANPCSLLFSAEMMLRSFEWKEAAQLIKDAIDGCFEEQMVTPDLVKYMPDGKSLSTTEFQKAVLKRITRKPKKRLFF